MKTKKREEKNIFATFFLLINIYPYALEMISKVRLVEGVFSRLQIINIMKIFSFLKFFNLKKNSKQSEILEKITCVNYTQDVIKDKRWKEKNPFDVC